MGEAGGDEGWWGGVKHSRLVETDLWKDAVCVMENGAFGELWILWRWLGWAKYRLPKMEASKTKLGSLTASVRDLPPQQQWLREGRAKLERLLRLKSSLRLVCKWEGGNIIICSELGHSSKARILKPRGSKRLRVLTIMWHFQLKRWWSFRKFLWYFIVIWNFYLAWQKPPGIIRLC